jgi:glucose-6-phosphate isomerase
MPVRGFFAFGVLTNSWAVDTPRADPLTSAAQAKEANMSDLLWKLSQTTTQESPATLKKAEDALRVLKARKDLGFLRLTDRAELWTNSENRARELRKSSHSLAVLGMGGSSLGGRALLQALKKFNETHVVDFIDNVDSERFWLWLKSRTDLQERHWVIVSKSGNTIETLTMAEFADQHLRSSGFKKISANSTAISELDDNPLMRWARKEGVPSLEIPKDVGGRFSILSPVGLLPAAFYGLDLDAIKEGALWALTQDELISRLAAQSLASFDRKEWITLFWAYADGLREFGLWTQQLWAESLGKAKNRQGGEAPRASTPIPAIGSSDQHSIHQQVMEGARDKFVWFFRVEESEGLAVGGSSDAKADNRHDTRLEKNLFDCQGLMNGKTMGQLFSAMASATRSALEEQKVQSLTLTAQRLDEKSMGALFMMLELVVGTIGEAMDINAFDQPGVELGKRLARGILTDK